MRNKIIKRQILIPMISLVVLCGFLVLAISIITYSNKVYDVTYDRIERTKTNIDYIFADIRNREQFAIYEITQNLDYASVIETGDANGFETQIETILAREHLNYALVTDAKGNVVLRVYDGDGAFSDNVMSLSQVQRALEGETTSTTFGMDDDPLRIATCAPLYSGGEIIGTLTVGHTLDKQPYALSLRSTTGNDIVFYDGSAAVASTLSYVSITYTNELHANGVIDYVLEKGNTYRGVLHLNYNDMVCIVYPMYGVGDDIVGMLCIATHIREINGEVFRFAIPASISFIIFVVLTVFVTLFITKNIIKKLDIIEEHMLNRDKLFEAVNQASIILLEIDETDDVRVPLISCMEHIGIALRVDHVHLWRSQLDEDGKNQFVREYSWVSEYGKRKARTPKYINVSTDKTQLNWMDQFLKNEHITGLVADMEPSYQDLVRPLDAKTIAMIPLFLEDSFWGMFSIDNIHSDRVFSDDEINILRSISLMMANVVRRHDLQNENLKVYFDALTGINNRRYFDKTMARIISSLSRSGSTLGVLMIDVDYFKKFNDTYGHGAGDECLVRVAEILAQSATRVDDFVARYGGEEFVVVMPNTDKEGAVAVANRMLENIRAAAIPHKASEVAEIVTVSIGITTGKVTQHLTSESYVKMADDMLYKSKHEGRNRFTYGSLDEEALSTE